MDRHTHTAMIFGPEIRRDICSIILQRFSLIPLKEHEPSEKLTDAAGLAEEDVKDLLQLKGILNPFVTISGVYRPTGRYSVGVTAHVNGFDPVRFEVPLGARQGAAA